MVRIDNEEKVVKLNPSTTIERVDLNAPFDFRFGNLYTKNGKGVFGYVEEENQENINTSNWKKIENFNYEEKHEMELNPRQSVLFLQEIESTENQNIAVEIGSGNGVYLLLNGKYITAHLLPTQDEYQKEIVVLPLEKGKNQLLIKYFNHKADRLNFSITPITGWIHYKMKLPAFKLKKSATHQLSIKESNPDSKVSPLRMNNVEVRF